MHTRRLGAFLIGAWLLGTLLVMFTTSQSYRNVDRFLTSPPPQASTAVDNVGSELMRQILRFQASEHNRHVKETWEMMQLGLGAALLATSFLTSHRSRVVFICAALMIAMVLTMYLYFTPVMNALARSFDLLPLTAAVREREDFSHYAVWYRVFEVLKTMLALVVAARLLFDRYELQDKLIPAGGGQNNRLRRRRHSASSDEGSGFDRESSSAPDSSPARVNSPEPEHDRS
jgi:hypothetical protein